MASEDLSYNQYICGCKKQKPLQVAGVKREAYCKDGSHWGPISSLLAIINSPANFSRLLQAYVLTVHSLHTTKGISSKSNQNMSFPLLKSPLVSPHCTFFKKRFYLPYRSCIICPLLPLCASLPSSPTTLPSLTMLRPQAFVLFIEHPNLFPPQGLCTSHSFCLDRTSSCSLHGRFPSCLSGTV